MCGIAGIHAPGAAADPRVVAAMTRRLVHRGPDGDGFFEAPGIALGMRRLAIIDPQGGHQPLLDESGDLVAVFNGEIYNHAELRRELTRNCSLAGAGWTVNRNNQLFRLGLGRHNHYATTDAQSRTTAPAFRLKPEATPAVRKSVHLNGSHRFLSA